MNKTKFITVVYFLAFNRPLKASFEDNHPIMRYTLKRRINLICNSALILKIETYEAQLVNTEVLNKEEWDKSQTIK